MNKKLILSTILGILINPAMSMETTIDTNQKQNEITNDISITANTNVSNTVNINNDNCIISKSFTKITKEMMKICPCNYCELIQYYKCYKTTLQDYINGIIKNKENIKIKFLDSKGNEITNGYFKDVNKVIFSTNFLKDNPFFNLEKFQLGEFDIHNRMRNNYIYIYKILKEKQLIESYPNEFLVQIDLDWIDISLDQKKEMLETLLGEMPENVEQTIDKLQQNSKNSYYNKYVNCPINFNLNIEWGKDQKETVNLLNKEEIQKLSNVLKEKYKNINGIAFQKMLKNVISESNNCQLYEYEIGFYTIDSKNEEYTECPQENLLTDIQAIVCTDDFSDDKFILYTDSLKKMRNFLVHFSEKLNLNTPNEYFIQFDLNYEDLFNNETINNENKEAKEEKKGGKVEEVKKVEVKKVLNRSKVQKVLGALKSISDNFEKNCEKLEQKGRNDKYVKYPIQITLNFKKDGNTVHEIDLLNKEEINNILKYLLNSNNLVNPGNNSIISSVAIQPYQIRKF